MFRKYIISISLIFLGFLSFITFSIIGSEVGPDGVLHEPFALLPIGLFLVVSGLVYGLIKSSVSVYKNKTKKDLIALGVFSLTIAMGIVYIIASMMYLTHEAVKEISDNQTIATTTTQAIDSSDSAQTANTTNAVTPQTQIANPASTNCVKVGGTLQILKKGDGGEYGLCYFEDNRACEEWALLRGECQVGGRKTTGYDTIDQNYCAWNGGETFAVSNSVCTFKNGGKCSTIDFYNGVCLKK